MTRRESNVVVGGKPVNRRTAARAAVAAGPAVSPVAQERVLAARLRSRLGASLSDQLRSPGGRTRAPLPAPAVVGGIVAACGGVGLLLGAVQSSLLMAGAGGIGMTAGAALAWTFRRRASDPLSDVPTQQLLGDDAIEALDRAFDRLAPEVPASLVQPLAEFKQLVARIARHPQSASTDEFFTVEDRLYVVECVRRYLPDSLQSYLAVPRSQRAVALADGGSAESLLASQLDLLRSELEQREAKLARSAAEQLVRQQRFLQSKRSAG